MAPLKLPRPYSIARRLVGDDAEDAVQDCLLKAFQRYDQLSAAAAGPAWLATILVNCCRDRGRTKTRRPEELDFGALEEFSLYRKIAYEDPFPYSDSLHLDFLVEEHLARCRRCCGELEFAKELRQFLANSGREDIPEEVMRRLNQTLEELGP